MFSHGLAGLSSFVTSVVNLPYKAAKVTFITFLIVLSVKLMIGSCGFELERQSHVPDIANSFPIHPRGPLEKVQSDL